MKQFKPITMVFLWLILLTCSSCNKEKAEALKVAVENFRNETILSIDSMNELFSNSMSVLHLEPEEEKEKIIADLQQLPSSDAITSDILSQWSDEVSIGDQQQEQLEEEFQKIKRQYYQFEGMFTSLDKGSYFSKEAVKKAEAVSIKLTVQLINYAELIHAMDFQFTAKRVALLERMQEAKEESNPALQQQLFELTANDFIALRLSENKTQKEAVRLLLKAAEKGKLVSELIRNYDILDVQTILTTIGETLGYASNITGGNETVEDLITKYTGVKTNIEQDPYWSQLLTLN